MSRGGKGKGKRKDRATRTDEMVLSDNGVAVKRYGNDRGTKERSRHDPVAVVDTLVGKRRARAARVKDTIARLQSNGTIDAAMVWAARRFQGDFDTAALDPLRAGALERRSPGRSDDSATMAARERVANATQALGGHGSPAALAIWFVVGGGYTIKDWALRQRWGSGGSLNELTARGILIGALAALQGHYAHIS
jgi:hypothetical protein